MLLGKIMDPKNPETAQPDQGFFIGYGGSKPARLI
jgi:hypothetical protein